MTRRPTVPPRSRNGRPLMPVHHRLRPPRCFIECTSGGEWASDDYNRSPKR